MNKELYFKILKVLLVLTSIIVVIGVVSMSMDTPRHTTRGKQSVAPSNSVPSNSVPSASDSEGDEEDEINELGGMGGITPSISLNDLDDETNSDLEEEPKTERDKFLKNDAERRKEIYNMNDIE